jgi:hypothetical protein
LNSRPQSPRLPSEAEALNQINRQKAATTAVNIDRTLCYHFATQRGSTGRYRLRQAKPSDSISADKSILVDTAQNAVTQSQTHYECVALPAELPRQGWLNANAIPELPADCLFTPAGGERRGKVAISWSRAAHSSLRFTPPADARSGSPCAIYRFRRRRVWQNRMSKAKAACRRVPRSAFSSPRLRAPSASPY